MPLILQEMSLPDLFLKENFKNRIDLPMDLFLYLTLVLKAVKYAPLFLVLSQVAAINLKFTENMSGEMVIAQKIINFSKAEEAFAEEKT